MLRLSFLTGKAILHDYIGLRCDTPDQRYDTTIGFSQQFEAYRKCSLKKSTMFQAAGASTLSFGSRRLLPVYSFREVAPKLRTVSLYLHFAQLPKLLKGWISLEHKTRIVLKK